ncbi:MAG: prepilin-type N-terminal cleavage/methylation domain-containing protein [Sedimentisphaerales bacterium]|nr:prepilin-type N-terminal cleavage/methylation domain-containing protein [Sedimentisphaerales bacterium]
MCKQKAFTLVELLVVMAIIALLMSILAPALHRAREQGKRIVCMNNLKQLTFAWILYSDDWNDRIINGDAGHDHGGETAWVQKAWHDDYASGALLSEAAQSAAIRAGSMWDYAKNLDLYRCPTGYRGELLTYTVMDSMNAYPQPGDTHGRGPVQGLINKTRSSIKRAPYRIVFIDEGYVTPDSFAVHNGTTVSESGQWWDDPTVRHGDGTCIGMADGRAEYKKWAGSKTVKAGHEAEKHHAGGITPESEADWEDLLYVQKSCWWKLNYTPPYNPPF